MPNYRAVSGALKALRSVLFNNSVPVANTLGFDTEKIPVSVLESSTFKKDIADHDNSLGIYLHRISVDTMSRNRLMSAPDPNKPKQPELPLNLHVLLMVINPNLSVDNRAVEAQLLAWAMQQIGTTLHLQYDQLNEAESDAEWGYEDKLQIVPEDMTTEDLLRILDGLGTGYMLSAPYVIKDLRILPAKLLVQGAPPVIESEFRYGGR